MTAIGSWLLQTALVSALRTNPEVAALVTGVYDEVPEGTVGDYIVVGEGVERDDSFFGQRGHAVMTDIEVWTPDGAASSLNVGGAGYKRAMRVAELIAAMLLEEQLVVDGHTAIVLLMDELNRKRFTDVPRERVVVPRFLVLLEDLIDEEEDSVLSIVSLTNGQIAAIGATPFYHELIPAPGAGKALWFREAFLNASIVAAYTNLLGTNDEVLHIGYPHANPLQPIEASAWLVAGGLLDAGTGTFNVPLPAFTQVEDVQFVSLAHARRSGGLDLIENKPLVLRLAGGPGVALTGGDSANRFRTLVRYDVVTLL